MTILSIGELLWDVFPDSERLGGAALNFSAHARRLGHQVAFLTAVGDDARGRAARAAAEEMGLPAEFIQTARGLPTGVVTVSLDAGGQPGFIIHRPAAYDAVRLAEADFERLRSLEPRWIYFGTLFQMNEEMKRLTLRLMEANPQARRFYDVNLRRDNYTPALVGELLERSTVVKLNEDEAGEVSRMLGWPPAPLEEFARSARTRFGWEAVCVTRGGKGCALLAGDVYAEVDGYRVPVADTVGAGDAFAAAFLHGLAAGWTAPRIGDFANRAGALVASRPGGAPEWSPAECAALVRE